MLAFALGKEDKAILRIGASALAFLFIGLILFVTHSFVGNPISKALSTQAAKKHLEENYPDLALKPNKAAYSFKDGQYFVFVRSTESMDTHFSIYCNAYGKVLSDDYRQKVTGGWNTYIRLHQQCQKVLTPIIEDNLPYQFDMILAGLDDKAVAGKSEMSNLSLDMPLDLHQPPFPITLSVTLYIDVLSWKNIAKIALELDALMQDKDIEVSQYSISLTHKKEGKIQDNPPTYLSIYDFPRELLSSKNLPIVMKNFYQEWEKQNEK